MTLPEIRGRALVGDDAEGAPGAGAQIHTTYQLPDGYSMQWKRPAALVAKAPE